MKIAFLIQDYDYHGGAQKTATLAKQFQLLGHDVTIIAIRCKESDFSCRPKIFFKRFGFKCTNFISSVLSLTKLFVILNMKFLYVLVVIATFALD